MKPIASAATAPATIAAGTHQRNRSCSAIIQGAIAITTR